MAGMLPGFTAGAGSSLTSGSSADMGSDYGQRHFGNIVFGNSGTPEAATQDTVKWVALVVGAVLVAKVLKG